MPVSGPAATAPAAVPELTAALSALFCDLRARGIGRLGVAVSGGGDSLALLDLLIMAAPAAGLTLEAATVDHGLRPEAAAEAAMVARFCAAQGIAHRSLVWRGSEARGNLQAEARSARYRLLGAWAQERGLGAVALAHNREDLAETFLMRLGRAAGLDGLAAMAPAFQRDNMLFLRPLLNVGRETLRGHLRARGVPWAEDPSNADPDYTRVRMRALLAVLAEAGITPEAISHSAQALAQSRDWLQEVFAQEWTERVTLQGGDLLISGLPEGEEPARRLLLAALRLVGDQPWPLRRAKLAALQGDLTEGMKRSLAGCLITQKNGILRISRELSAISGLRTAPDALFDNRWRLNGPAPAGSWLAPLGEGIRHCPDWRLHSPLPRASVMAAPALWGREGLIAAPLARAEAEYSLRLRKGWGQLPFLH